VSFHFPESVSADNGLLEARDTILDKVLSSMSALSDVAPDSVTGVDGNHPDGFLELSTYPYEWDCVYNDYETRITYPLNKCVAQGPTSKNYWMVTANSVRFRFHKFSDDKCKKELKSHLVAVSYAHANCTVNMKVAVVDASSPYHYNGLAMRTWSSECNKGPHFDLYWADGVCLETDNSNAKNPHSYQAYCNTYGNSYYYSFTNGNCDWSGAYYNDMSNFPGYNTCDASVAHPFEATCVTTNGVY